MTILYAFEYVAQNAHLESLDINGDVGQFGHRMGPLARNRTSD